MKIISKSALCLALTLSVAACACPRTETYKGNVPYEAERTAGDVMVEADGYCFKKVVPPGWIK